MSEIVAYGLKPADAALWPVTWVDTQQQVLNAERGLLVSSRELLYYENGLKKLSSNDCYDSLKRGQHNFFAEVIKRQNRYPKTFLDPTAGWGREAISAALLGVNVVVMEKQSLPLSFLLYARSFLYPGISSRFDVIPGCFSEHSFNECQFDCVYLDPLFFENKKTTSKKTMCLLYQDENNQQSQNILLTKGLSRLKPQTLIVKNPIQAPERKISGVLQHIRHSRSCRYDIFYTNQQAINYDDLFN